MYPKKYYLKNHCIECNKLIHYQATRCRKCADKALIKPKKIYYCKICHKKIGKSSGEYGSGLCRKCGKTIFIDKNVLIKKYINEKKSITIIAQEVKCNYVSIYNKLLDYNIILRTKRESHLGKLRPEHSLLMKGENNPNFNNWSSLETYSKEFTNDFKDSIRARDSHKCQYCSKTEEQEIKDYNRKLSIHHIDYNKQNCNEENLVSLCDKCHCKSNFNRDFWFAYFTEIINSIYQLI